MEEGRTEDVKTFAGFCFDPLAVDEGLIPKNIWIIELGGNQR